MRYHSESRVARVLVCPHAVAERLAIWSEQAREAGRFDRADQLLLSAWEAFDLPSAADTFGRWPDAAETGARDEPWMDKAA
jgi:hypothetical protein